MKWSQKLLLMLTAALLRRQVMAVFQKGKNI